MSGWLIALMESYHELLRARMAPAGAIAAEVMKKTQRKHQQLGKRATLTICQLLQDKCGPLEVLRIHGCGRTTYNEIEKMMHDNGYWLNERRFGIWR